MATLDKSRVYPQAVEQLFIDHWPGFAEESNADRGFLTLLVINCYRQKRYRHSHYEGMTQYYCRVRDGHFGRGRFQEINARLHLFEVTDGYCKGSFTRGYALEPDAQSLIENLPLSPTAMVDPQGNVIRTPATYGIESKDCNGQTRKGQGNLPASIHVNVDALLELQREGLQWKWHYKDGLPAPTQGRLQKRLAGIETDQKRLTWLHFHLDIPIKLTLLQADTYHLPKGTAEVTYREAESGRLYANSGFMQTACREIRAAAFQNLWDYDFSACHHSLLSQLARRVGIDTPALDQYLWEKTAIRRQIAEEIDVPLAAVKSSMIALVYGAQRRTSPIPGKKELPAILDAMGSEEKARAFFAHPFVKALYDDLHKIRKPIIDAMPKKRGFFVNGLGKGIRETEPPERILAHQLQGSEAACLGAVLQTSGENLTLLLHDGFISRIRLNTDELTDAIFKSTGFLMEIEEAQLR